jgi:hypothetical protein
MRIPEKSKSPVAHARGSERTSHVWEELPSRDREGAGAVIVNQDNTTHNFGDISRPVWQQWPAPEIAE